MNQYTLIARKNIENQYDSECSIYELKPKIVNNITKDVETEVFKNKKCRISFEDMEKSIKKAMIRNILLGEVSFGKDNEMIILYP